MLNENAQKLKRNKEILMKNGLTDVEIIDFDGNFKRRITVSNYNENRYGYDGKIIGDGLLYMLYTSEFECRDREDFLGFVDSNYLVAANILGHDFKINVTKKSDMEILKCVFLIYNAINKGISLKKLEKGINTLDFFISEKSKTKKNSNKRKK